MVSARFVVPVVLCLALAGCAGGPASPNASEGSGAGDGSATPAPSASASAGEVETKVGDNPAVVSVLNGPLGDDAFFDDVEQGIKALGEAGWTTKTVEAPLNDPVSWKANLEAASSGDFDLVVVGTVQMAEILEEVAPKHPDQQYVIWDVVVDAPNVTSITFAQNEGSYLAGVLAAKASQDKTAFPKSEGMNHVGVVAGMESPVIDEFIGGFKAGVASVSPDIKVDVAYVGSFTDANAGAQQAKAMYDQGVDVIYAIAGGASLGVAHAAKAADDYAIGVDLNMNPVEPGYVLASMVKQIGRSIADTGQGIVDKKIKPGTVQVIGLDAGLGLTFEGNDNAVPEAVIKELDTTAQDIINGKIQVPTALTPQ